MYFQFGIWHCHFFSIQAQVGAVYRKMYSLKLILLVVVLVLGSLTSAYRPIPTPRLHSLRCKSTIATTFSPRACSTVLRASDSNDAPPSLQRLVQDLSFRSWTFAQKVVPKSNHNSIMGLLASNVETAIDTGKALLNNAGIEHGYGASIVLFTMLAKTVMLPLTIAQLESTAKMQKLVPLQQKIQAKFANDDRAKSRFSSDLFSAAQVNPLFGGLLSLVQIPVFMSLNQALTNLAASGKLDEPFLWIPSLQGPAASQQSTSDSKPSDWLTSALSGKPSLGWHDTLAYLSLPLILLVTQVMSQKALSPPQDPERPLSQQQQLSQTVASCVPFVTAFAAINKPSAVVLYSIINSFFTTVITAAVRSNLKELSLPLEVDQVMTVVDKTSSTQSRADPQEIEASSPGKALKTLTPKLLHQ